MVKHAINIARSVEPVTKISVQPAETTVASVGQTDLYEQPTQGEEVLRASIFWYPDGSMLSRPDVASGQVIHLHCNGCQAGIIDKMCVGGEFVEPAFVYFRSETDAGVHCGKDPFDSDEPIRF